MVPDTSLSQVVSAFELVFTSVPVMTVSSGVPKVFPDLDTGTNLLRQSKDLMWDDTSE